MLRLVAILPLVFAGAAFAGSRVDVHPGKTEPEIHGDMAVRGLAGSDRGYTLELGREPLSFRIIRDGKPVRDFDVEHTKRMHVIVVRRDLTGFQHLHPTMRADGTWKVPLTLGGAGVYRVYADFAVDGEPHTLAADLTADGGGPPAAAPGALEPRPRRWHDRDPPRARLHRDALRQAGRS